MVISEIPETAKIGKNVKIWNFAYIGDHVELGDNVIVGSLSQVDRRTKIGENTSIQSHVCIGPDSRIGKNVFIGPNVTFTNDPYPTSNRTVPITIKDGVVIGASVTIGPGITIGENSIVGMNSMVTRDVPDNVVVAGTPATFWYSREEYDKKQKEWNERGVS